jgi:hypothetical protein
MPRNDWSLSRRIAVGLLLVGVGGSVAMLIYRAGGGVGFSIDNAKIALRAIAGLYGPPAAQLAVYFANERTTPEVASVSQLGAGATAFSLGFLAIAFLSPILLLLLISGEMFPIEDFQDVLALTQPLGASVSAACLAIIFRRAVNSAENAS